MEALELDQTAVKCPVTITVVGVGGAGCNAVDRMISVDIPEVSYVVLNTDAQALERSDAQRKICLGGPRTRGLGAGGNPTVGAAAAKLSLDEITRALEGSDLVFIAAGMGGGTGSGAAPVVADAARSVGALTVGVVTSPFSFEGFRRRKVAEEALAELEKHVDTLIVVPNDKLLAFTSEKITLDIAFRIADDVLRQGIQGISEVITRPGLINVDFADVRKIMSQGGTSLMSIAQAKGPERALEAAQSAIASPLIATESISGAKGILINVVGGPDMTLHEAGQAVEYITEQASEDAEVIFGAAIDNSMGDKLQITLIATGVGSAAQTQRRPVAATVAPAPARQPLVAERPQPQRGGIAVPREFEERLARVRDNGNGNGNGHGEPRRTERVPEPALAHAGGLEIPTFLRRARGLL
ncbi:MAG: cell division protein FtsZ [Anaerolineae bacterium]